jgi:hypothetical protein
MSDLRGLRRHPRVRATAVLSLLVLSLGITGCASDVSAPYFATTPPTTIAHVAGSGLQLPSTGSPLARLHHGSVPRPKPALTPGAIAVTDDATVCSQSRRTRDPITDATKKAVLAAYGIPYSRHNQYSFDYLVPLDLGGAPVAANLWPLRRNTGFHEKLQLNARLRYLVCRGELPLAKVQKPIITDWYALWVQYAAVASPSPAPGTGLAG